MSDNRFTDPKYSYLPTNIHHTQSDVWKRRNSSNCALERPETPEEAKINDRSANDITIFILISAFVGFIAYYCFS